MISKAKMPRREFRDFDKITLTSMNNIYDICYTQTRNTKNNITLLDKDHYIVNSTGEVIDCKHIEHRGENLAQVRASLNRLCEYINTNVTNASEWLWVTLTYKDNMRDTKQLYLDMDKFTKRIRYQYKNYKIKYIYCMEPQRRGAWHCHALIGFDREAPFIPNATIEKLWGKGFTKTKSLNGIDNIGIYLCAYLGDLDLSLDEAQEFSKKAPMSLLNEKLKYIANIDGKDLEVPKAIIKGGRLNMYPPKFNIYRISRDIKKPVKEVMSYREAKEKIGLEHQPIHANSFLISDKDKDFENIIAHEYYNTKRA